MFNFTNPAGVVSQALRDMGYDFTLRYRRRAEAACCQLPTCTAWMRPAFTASATVLNHLSYFQSIKVDGKEIMPELIANDEAYAKTDMRFSRSVCSRTAAVC